MNVPATAPPAVQRPTSRPGTASPEDAAAPDETTPAVSADFLAALARAFATGVGADAAGEPGAIPEGDTKADGTPDADGTLAAAAGAAAAAAAVVPAPAPAAGASATPDTKGSEPGAPATAKVAATPVPVAAGSGAVATGANPPGDASAGATAKAAAPVVEKQAASAAKPQGGREPGGRETDGGVVASGSGGLGHGETREVRQPNGGADLSAPSPLPPDAVTAHAKTPDTPANGRDATALQPDTSAPTDAVRGAAPSTSHRPSTGDTAGDLGDSAGGKPSSGAGTKAPAHEAFTTDAPPSDAARPAHTSAPAPPSVVAHADGAPRVQTPDAPPAVASPPAREPQHAAPPPPPAPAPDIDRLVRLDQLRSMPRRDGGEMRIEVTPEGLGPVEVRVVVRADAVHATLLSNHEQAREALTAGRSSLEAALERSNLRLEGFTVDVGQQHRQSDPEPQRGASATTAWLRANGFEAPAPTSPLGVSAAAAQGLSLRA